jgi:hypothetical protein
MILKDKGIFLINEICKKKKFTRLIGQRPIKHG